MQLAATRALRVPAASVTATRRAASCRPTGQRARCLRPMAQATATQGKPATAKPPPPITLTEAALSHLQKLRAESGGEDLLLRMGVKSGGCSGMSYIMDFEKEENIKKDDLVMDYDGGFRLVCDPKSLLYLFGMHLDYSSALVGGGFQFNVRNPNAESSCGCGKSFGV